MIIQTIQSLLSSTQDVSQDIGINSPIAVVAILAGVAIIIREVAWGVVSISKRIKGEHPDAVNSKLADAIRDLSQNMKLQNMTLEQLSRDIDRSHMSVIRHFENLERDLRK